MSLAPSALPWSWRGYDDGEPFLGVSSAGGDELGFAWVAVEDSEALADVVASQPDFVAQTRADVEANLAALCAAVNGTEAEPPATARPWRVLAGAGWKGERVLSIVGPIGREEVLCWQHDAQTEADFLAAVRAVNARWP